MGQFLYKLFLGKPEYNKRLPVPAIQFQLQIIKGIWHNNRHDDIGLEKLIRLFLASVQFVFPAIYMRHFLWKAGCTYQAIAIEIYVLFKTAFPLALLLSGLYTNTFLVGITVYLLIETLCYIGALIFISDQLTKSRSYKRSMILLLIDYVKLAFDFAVLYGGLHLLGEVAKKPLDYIYFSFVTSATIGYGDLAPKENLGKLLVCCQSVIFLTFVVFVISLFTAKTGGELHNSNTNKNKPT